MTSRGRLWEYDVRTGAMLVDGGVALATVPHLAAPGTGVCAGRADAGCVLETRTFRVEPDGGVTEAITASDLTASGTAWSYEAFPPHTPLSTPLPNGSLLTARYSLLSSAPCYGLNPNECHFQTQAFLLLGNGDTLEFVTSAGKLFILDAVTGSAQADSNRKLSEIPRFRDTVCAGRAECRLRSHSFTTAPDGGLVESFSD
ncbi:MAG: hypothetical protein HY901_07605 [Deltaproteobacteria bacterium]|nr:hypothetical protein [Deltaproteobacteria bacterium]